MTKHLLKLLFLILMTLMVLNTKAATTATLVLKGTVAPLLNVSIAPEPIATSLPLAVTQSGTKVATITEQSNSFTGYSVTFTSQNLGKLVLNPTNFLNYSLTYNNQSVNLSSVTGQTFVNNWVNASPIDKNINISYTGTSSLPAGDYQDTITVTIVGN